MKSRKNRGEISPIFPSIPWWSGSPSTPPWMVTKVGKLIWRPLETVGTSLMGLETGLQNPEKTLLSKRYLSLCIMYYIYKSYVIYNIYDSMTLHMWYLYENHDDGSICILTTPSNSLYVAALLLRVFFVVLRIWEGRDDRSGAQEDVSDFASEADTRTSRGRRLG